MKSQPKAACNKNHGIVLIVALVFTLMLAIISMTAMQTALLQLRMAGNDQFLEEAFHIAEAIADELSQSPENFFLGTEVGHSNCPPTTEIYDCALKLLPMLRLATISEVYEIDYRITRQDPLWWRDYPLRQPQATLSSRRSFDAAIFEVEVRVDGSRVRRGTAHVVQGVAVHAGPSGEGIDSYDMKEDGGADNSKLLLNDAGKLYRTYWREPGIDRL